MAVVSEQQLLREYRSACKAQRAAEQRLARTLLELVAADIADLRQDFSHVGPVNGIQIHLGGEDGPFYCRSQWVSPDETELEGKQRLLCRPVDLGEVEEVDCDRIREDFAQKVAEATRRRWDSFRRLEQKLAEYVGP